MDTLKIELRDDIDMYTTLTEQAISGNYDIKLIHAAGLILIERQGKEEDLLMLQHELDWSHNMSEDMKKEFSENIEMLKCHINALNDLRKSFIKN